MTPGTQYVLYLRRYEVHGELTGECIPLTIGVFEIDGDIAITPEAARDFPKIPETVELERLRAMAVASAS